jgi:hypothetical protein
MLAIGLLKFGMFDTACRHGTPVMSNKSPDPPGQVENEGIEGKYANYFMVGHNAWEFLVDFGQKYMDQQVQVHTRIVTGPIYAKELLNVLSQSIEQYEAQFGEIKQQE